MDADELETAAQTAEATAARARWAVGETRGTQAADRRARDLRRRAERARRTETS